MKMTDIRNQKGGLLVEALAILGIVAVTSPMIYKKKIDKAQELEDIAKASQMKIIKDAVANYVDAKYEDYVLADGEESAKTKIIGLNEIADFLPPGFDEDKTIKIGIRSEKINGNNRVSAIVVDSEKFNEKRGNRVASLIGADGGYAGLDGTAVGNNSVWSVDPTKFGFTAGEVKSQLVSTTQFSKSAASGEYLYKYKVEGQPQVNMMMTNINMRGNDLNNTSSVGLMYGRDDKFTSWRLNGNKGEQYGDGTIVGKNTSGYDTVALQSNRAGKTVLAGAEKDLALVNGEIAGKEKEDPKVDGSGALTLRAIKGNTTGGCTEALANSDIGIGDGAGIFTACNNNASRTAYLMANGENGGGEMRVRKDGNQDAGATAYSDATDKGSAFEVTDNDGKVTGVIASNRSNAVNLYYKKDGKTEDNSAMELMTPDGSSKVVAVANSDGGSVALKDADDQETIRMIGEEATVVATTETNGKIAAGITGKNQKSNDVHNGYSEGQLVYNTTVSGRLTTDEKNPELTGGALFVRGNSDKTGVLVSGTSKTSKSGILTMGDTENRNVLISSEKGSSMSLANNGVAKITVEGDRKSGAVNGVSSSSLSKSGYFEVVGNGDANNPTARSEMYASLSGKLKKDADDAAAAGFDGSLGTFHGAGSVVDDEKGGGSYLAYNNNVGTVKLMSRGGYDDTDGGGTIELTPSDNGKDKAVITTSMKSELNASNVGAAARLSADGGKFAHFGANSEGNAGEMVLNSSSGRIEALGSQNSGGSMYFKRGDGSDGVSMTAAKGNSGNVKAYDENGAKVEIDGTEAQVMNIAGKATGVLGAGGLSLRNTTGKEKTGVEFSNKTDEGLQFYNPDAKKAIFAAGDTFQTGQNNELKLELQGDGDGVEGMNSGAALLVGKSDSVVKGAVLIRDSLTAATITAPVVKTDASLKFKDICILGKNGKEDDAACLSDAAAARTGNATAWKEKYGNLMDTDEKGRSNFGRALWQLVYDRVTDLMESSSHNDTHHLKKAWGDNVTVGGKTINIGTAWRGGRQGGYVTYLDDDANYIYLNKEGTKTASAADLKVGYFNVENNQWERIGSKSDFNDYNKYAKGETQHSAAGHEHGATLEEVSMKPRYLPKYGLLGADKFGQGRTAKEVNFSPKEEKEYAARGHYHWNYDESYSDAKCGEKYIVRHIKKGCVGSESDCVKVIEKTINCSADLSGEGFYQGRGRFIKRIDEKNNKWNRGGERFEPLDDTNYY